MKAKAICTSLLASILCLTTALPAVAQPSDDTRYATREQAREGREHRGGGKIMKLLQQLDLTADQEAQIKAILQESREEMRAQRSAVRESRQAMRNLMQQEGTDEAALRAAHQKASIHSEEMLIARFRVKQEINSLLTEQQRAELQVLKEETKENRRAKRGRGKRN